MNIEICNRLYGAFSKMSPGMRQCVLTGELMDVFFADMERGLCYDTKENLHLEQALMYYGLRNEYDIVLWIDARNDMKLHFATPAMETAYNGNKLVHRQSVDSQKTHRSVPRQRSSSMGVTQNSETSNHPDTTSATHDVQNRDPHAEPQNSLDAIGRLLDDTSVKSLVILSFAEKILEDCQNGELTFAAKKKLETVLSWEFRNSKNQETCSIVNVAKEHLDNFFAVANRHQTGWSERIAKHTIGKPEREEIEALLIRFKNRYKLLGKAKQVSKKLQAHNLSMLRIVETIKAKKKAIVARETVKLNDIFVDEDEVKRRKIWMEAEQELTDMVGLQSVKDKVRELVNLAKRIRTQKEQGVDTSAFSLHSLLLGDPGTGKTVVARILAKYYYGLGLRDKDTVVEVVPGNIASQYNPGDATKNLEAKIHEAMGGVLFLDEIYKYADDEWLKGAFENTLMTAMENHRDSLTILGAGYRGERLQKLFNMNEGIVSRFGHPDNTIDFPSYNTNELIEITEKMLTKSGCRLAEDARVPLERHIAGKIKAGSMENARGARTLVEAMIKKASLSTEISAMDIPSIERKSSIGEILHEIEEKFDGLKTVKDRIREIADEIEDDELHGMDSDAQYNMLFVGNPGTGKSTIARYMSRVFNALGLTSGTGVIERRALDLKAEFIGQSGKRVQDVFYQARKEGKVLFIDEAYSLFRGTGQDSFASDIIDQLVGQITATENSRVFVILAGYTDEMQTLMQSNPGLQSRFPEQFVVHFPDYSTEECLHILCKRLAQKKLTLHPQAEEPLLSVITQQKQDPHFGNARAMNTLADTLRSAFIKRRNQTKSDVTRTITLEDVEAVR